MRTIEEILEYNFSDSKLLKKALMHPSYAIEHNTESNQRLEFLGDAVLENVISKYIYTKFPELDEGKLTRLRASIVSETPLFEAAKEIELYNYVLLGTGESASGGMNKASVLSDTLEAVFAAVYLDGGFESAERVILKCLKPVIDNPALRPYDYKTELQEELFKNGEVTIEYKTVELRKEKNDTIFSSDVFCNGKHLGYGEGTSKKRAEMAAAKQAFEGIN